MVPAPGVVFSGPMPSPLDDCSVERDPPDPTKSDVGAGVVGVPVAVGPGTAPGGTGAVPLPPAGTDWADVPPLPPDWSSGARLEP